MIGDTLRVLGIPWDHAPKLLLGDARVRHFAYIAGQRGFRHESTVPIGVCRVCSRLVVRPSLFPGAKAYRPCERHGTTEWPAGCQLMAGHDGGCDSDPKRKDVHTEHCCIIHGCKYGADWCSVFAGRLPASHRQECCED